jgi:hypothetical protein
MTVTWKCRKKAQNPVNQTSLFSHWFFVANAIRRDGDGLVQTRGRMTGTKDALISLSGSADIFILPIDDRRDQRLAQVRAWAALKNNDPSWHTDKGDKAVKVLVIVHRMAAKRLGFNELYEALNDKAPEEFKSGFLDGTANAAPTIPHRSIRPLPARAKHELPAAGRDRLNICRKPHPDYPPKAPDVRSFECASQYR